MPNGDPRHTRPMSSATINRFARAVLLGPDVLLRQSDTVRESYCLTVLEPRLDA
jgi:hypothetical protein